MLFLSLHLVQASVYKQQRTMNVAVPDKTSLRQSSSQSQTSILQMTASQKPSCTCKVSDPSWKKTTRNSPKCVFIDLGAYDGNSFQSFLNNTYGDVKSCTNGTGDYDAFLVEASPVHDKALMNLQDGNKKVHALSSSAAYMCEGQTSFFISHGNGGIGSSISNTWKGQKVTVPTVNLMKIIYENTIPDDQVWVKMDVEGAEWDIMPCLASAPAATNIDKLFVEVHPKEWWFNQTNTHEHWDSKVEAQDPIIMMAKTALQKKGVDVPDYFSPTF